MLTARPQFSLTQREECPGDQQEPYTGSLASTSGAGVSSQNPPVNHSQLRHPLLWNRACVCRTGRPIRHRRGAKSPAGSPESHRPMPPNCAICCHFPKGPSSCSSSGHHTLILEGQGGCLSSPSMWAFWQVSVVWC